MYSVHDSSVASKNDRKAQINLLDELHMFDDPAHRGNDKALVEPVVRVDFVNGVERHLFHGEVFAQENQPIHVPCVEAHLAWPEVVLLAHVTILAPSRGLSSCPRTPVRGAPIKCAPPCRTSGLRSLSGEFLKGGGVAQASSTATHLTDIGASPPMNLCKLSSLSSSDPSLNRGARCRQSLRRADVAGQGGVAVGDVGHQLVGPSLDDGEP